MPKLQLVGDFGRTSFLDSELKEEEKKREREPHPARSTPTEIGAEYYVEYGVAKDRTGSLSSTC